MVFLVFLVQSRLAPNVAPLIAHLLPRMAQQSVPSDGLLHDVRWMRPHKVLLAQPKWKVTPHVVQQNLKPVKKILLSKAMRNA